VDPAARTLRHYQLQGQGRYGAAQVYDQSMSLRFACLPTLSLPIGDLFVDAADTSL
jgi:hypothetical protein